MHCKERKLKQKTILYTNLYTNAQSIWSNKMGNPRAAQQKHDHIPAMTNKITDANKKTQRNALILSPEWSSNDVCVLKLLNLYQAQFIENSVCLSELEDSHVSNNGYQFFMLLFSEQQLFCFSITSSTQTGTEVALKIYLC